ncbi:hypothetical protein CSA17_00015 [bacterium DOLJORAL78_65_58]|nr:MAG: hypothetical protein CSA17_00015 [bacterium DOLJORAL78_65_58]
MSAAVFYAGMILMATLLTTLILLTTRQVLVAWRRDDARSWALVGLLVGVTGLARGNNLILLAALPPLIFLRREQPWPRRLTHGALVMATGLLLLVPSTVRNLIVADDFVLLTSNGGINLLIGQQPQHAGLFAPVMEEGQEDYDISLERTLEREQGRDLKGSEVSRILTRRAWNEFQANLGAMPRHYLWKIYRFWNGYELPQIFSYGHWRQRLASLRFLPVNFTLLAACGLLGLGFLPTGKRRVLVVLLLAYFLSLLPFFPTARYRLPIAPLLAVTSAVFLRAAWGMPWARRRWWLAAVSILVMALLPRWAQLETPEVDWQVYLREASRASKRGDLKTTLASGRQAEETRPGLAETSYRLAIYLEELEAWPQAEAALRLAQARAPRERFIPYRLGRCQEKQGQWEAALGSFRQAAQLAPDWALPWLRAGLTLQRAGLEEEALQALQKAHALSPGNHQIRSNLASAYASTGRLREARSLLEDLVRDYPNYMNGWFNLALVQARMGDTAGARKSLSGAASLRGLTPDQESRIRTLRQQLQR